MEDNAIPSPSPSQPVGAASDVGDSRPRGGLDAAIILRDAEKAARLLGFDPARQAVLLASEWHVPAVPFAFEHLEEYEAVAQGSRFVVVSLSRPEAGGVEHLLFMARQAGLADDVYLNCIDPSKRTFVAKPQVGPLS